jgi:hypothetical protein
MVSLSWPADLMRSERLWPALNPTPFRSTALDENRSTLGTHVLTVF